MRKKFRFLLKKSVIVMMSAAFFLCVLGIFLNVLRVAKWTELSLWQQLSAILMLALCAAVLVFLTAAFIKAEYSIEEKAVVARYGFLRTRVPFSAIEEAVLLKKSGKLALYYGGNGVLFITIKESEYDEFVDSLKESCKNLKYDVDYEEEEKQ